MRIIDEDILSMDIPQPEPDCGSLLIAEPLMNDGCFQRATVCVIDHNEDSGTMGFVTNRMSGYMLSELVDGIEIDEDIPVFIGGPVHRERLYYLHTFGADVPDSVEVIPGLFVGGDFERIKELINMGAEIYGNIRFFIGYSGWEKGQLRQELDKSDWAVASIESVEDILTLSENDAWRNAVITLGERYRVWLNFPIDALLN